MFNEGGVERFVSVVGAVLGVATAAFLSGCGSGANDACAGLGCASEPGALVLHVVDSRGKPVASPTFSTRLRSNPPSPAMSLGQGQCQTDGGTQQPDGGVCGAWVFFASEGPQTVTVSAPGFVSQSVTVTIEGPATCCGSGPTVDRTVTLAAR